MKAFEVHFIKETIRPVEFTRRSTRSIWLRENGEDIKKPIRTKFVWYIAKEKDAIDALRQRAEDNVQAAREKLQARIIKLEKIVLKYPKN